MKRSIFVLMILAIFLSRCQSQPPSLIGNWRLVSYGPADSMTAAAPDIDARLTFSEDGTVWGSGGCNSINGKYRVQGNQVTFRDMAGTLMGCDNVRMQQDGAMFQALSSTVQFEIQDQELTILGDDVKLRFRSVSTE